MKNIQVLGVKLVREKVVPYTESINGGNMVVDILRQLIQDEPQEVFAMVCLNTKNKVVGIFEVHRGAVDRSIVSLREIAQRALLCNATSVIVAHNHPSGDCTPSQNDHQVHELLGDMFPIIGIRYLDNIIIGDDEYYSFEGGRKVWY